METVVVPPRNENRVITGFTLRRDRTGPDSAKITLRLGGVIIAETCLRRNEGLTVATSMLPLLPNQALTVESEATVYVDNIYMQSLDAIHMWACGTASFPNALGEPLPTTIGSFAVLPSQIAGFTHLPLSSLKEENTKPKIDVSTTRVKGNPRVHAMIDSLEPKK